MASTFAGIEVASRALRANQTIMSTLGHNLANVNTPGYSRQVVKIVTTDPYTLPSVNEPRPGQMGTGVDVAGISRIVDPFIDQRVANGLAVQGSFQKTRDLLTRVETSLGEPSESGISNQLQQFFNRLQDLSRNPESGAVRATVVQQAGALARRFNQVWSELDAIAQDATQQIATVVGEANAVAKQVAVLNKEIVASVGVGDVPNDLMDRRDELLRRLSTLVGATYRVDRNGSGNSNGSVSVFVNGTPLVLGEDAFRLPTDAAYVGSVPQLTDGTTFTPLTGGQAHGMLVAAAMVAGYRDQVNIVATTLINRVNELHRGGYGLDNVSGRDFFAGSDAGSIRVDAGILADSNTIAAASPPAPGYPMAPGNGQNALAMAQIANEALLGSFTISGYYTDKISKIGADSQSYQNQSANQDGVVVQLGNLRSQISGVSLDEEMSQMLQYQRSYQASARYLTVVDEMLNTVINQMGR
jgi:flagellar hook-associated protein 1 FlgK